MLSEAKNQGTSSLPGLVAVSMGIERTGFSLALASGILMVFESRFFTSSLVRPLPSRLTFQVNVNVLPNRL